MPRKILREAYDIWGNSLGFVLFAVPDDFKERDAPPPPQASNQYFATSKEAMNEIRRLMEDPSDGASSSAAAE